MPNPTHIALATHTLTSTTTTITFSNIPSTYRDLVIVANFRMSGIGSATRLRFNSNSDSNAYTSLHMASNGSAINAYLDPSTSMRVFGQAAGPTTNWQVGIIEIFDYSQTNKNTMVLGRYSGGDNDVAAFVGRWINNSLVTSVTLFDVLGQSYQIGDTFSLYGIEG
jgi:hypothetical protein